MSEYQYHEWQTIDRMLTPKEQAAVNQLSSHIEVSSSQAVVTYNWGDFKHDPKDVLLQYFDAYFYMANWGSRHLMFRFPTGLLDLAEIKRYCDGDFVTFETYGEYQVLDIDFNPEDGGNWVDLEDVDLNDFINLRAELLDGDYRLLYLTWLMAMTYSATGFEDEESEEDDLEPPVPPGLKKLSPDLQNFVKVFGIDPFLVQAAAEASPDLRQTPPIDYPNLVSRLSRAECDKFLVRLAQGDTSTSLSLRRRLSEFIPKEPVQTGKGEQRPLQQMLRRAKQLEAGEKKRQAQEAHRRHVAEMKALAQKEPQVWRQVEDLLARGSKSASTYDEATRLLDQLKELADFQDTRDAFFARVRTLADRYASRPSLMNRWNLRGWL